MKIEQKSRRKKKKKNKKLRQPVSFFSLSPSLKPR